MRRLITRLALMLCAVGMLAAFSIGGNRANAQEEPTVVAIEPKLCTALLFAFNNVDTTTAALTCGSLLQAGGGNLQLVAAFLTQANGKDDVVLADPDDPSSVRIDIPCTADTNNDGEVCGPGDTGVDDGEEVRNQLDERNGERDGLFELFAEDFAAIDLDGNQLHEEDGQLVMLTFVEDDEAIRFKTDNGRFTESVIADPGSDDEFCGPLTDPATTFTDEDCDEDGVPGDGVVATLLFPCGGDCVDRGPGVAYALQSGLFGFLNLTVVGELNAIEFTPLKTTAMAGTEAEDCTFDLNVAGVTEALSNPNLAIFLVHAVDDDGTQIASALLDWEVTNLDDDEKVIFAFPTTPTVDTGVLGMGFPQAICGDEGTGVVSVTARTSAQAGTLDPASNVRKASIDVTITGEPENISLVADPPGVPCDGVATSKVTATVTDSEGNNVADGLDIGFSVQVLGTASPLSADLTGGVASSTITPLAGEATGVPVVVTAGDIQASILVNCVAGSAVPPPPPPGAPGGTPGGTISPPDTGTSGGGGTGRLSWWPALLLTVGAGALIASRALVSTRTR